MDEPMIKIALAAKTLDMSYKTLYNWIEDGTLKLAHPGYVRMSDVHRARIKKMNERSEWGRVRSGMFFRDSGRFKLLRGDLKDEPIE
jgi:hypothetical protein